MAHTPKDAPTATAAIRRQAGVIIIVQLVLAGAILGAAVWSFFNLMGIKAETKNAMEATERAVAAQTQAEQTATELGNAADAYLTQIRGAMQSLSKGQDATFETSAASREQAILDLRAARTQFRDLKDSELAIMLRARKPNPVELSDDGDLLALEMQRAIARAYKVFGQPTQAWNEMNEVIATGLKEGKSGPHLAPVEDIAGDYILRATFACRKSPNDQNFAQDDDGVLADLEAAHTDVKARLTFESLANSPALRDGCPGVMAKIKARLSSGETKGPGPAPAPVQDAAAFNVNELFLHVADEAEYKAARQVRDQLRNKAAGETVYKVLGIEIVGPAAKRSIRYYYNVQAPQAKIISEDVLKAIADAIAAVNADAGMAAPEKTSVLAILQKWSTPLDDLIPLEGKYQRLPPHRAEVWF